MIRILVILLAAGALVGIGAGGALLLTPDKLQLVVDAGGESARTATPPPPPDRTGEVLGRIDTLRDALAAFATALDDSAAERDAIGRELAAERREAARARATLQARLDRVTRQLDDARAGIAALASAGARPVPAVEAPAEPAPEPEVATPEPVAATKPAPKRRSLAELLAERPHIDVRDRAATWSLSAGHCRVGFDGRSTIHNFTARSGAVEGTFRLHFRQPADGAGGELRLGVATLDSSNADRDQEIVRHLAGEKREAPEIRCEILSITAADGQEGDARKATAKVRFHIHGKAHEADAPLDLEFTSQRLLHVKGETKIRMSDFDIHPKAKLGVIKVEDEVTVWWDLYAEVAREDN